jgi:hypothetical protein
MYDLTLNAANAIPFVMVNTSGTEVTGLAGTFTVTLSRNGGAFGASAGAKSELGNGWYLYTATAAECATAGPLALRVTGTGCAQQNLVLRVAASPSTLGSGAITFTYTLTNSVDGLPIADADVWVTSDIAGTNVLASGRTNASGVVTLYLDAGTIYVWRQKSGWNFTNPDTEVVA